MLGCVVMPKGDINYTEDDELQLFSEFLHLRHCFSIEPLRDCLCFALGSTYIVCGRGEPTGHVNGEQGVRALGLGSCSMYKHSPG